MKAGKVKGLGFRVYFGRIYRAYCRDRFLHSLLTSEMNNNESHLSFHLFFHDMLRYWDHIPKR